MAYAPTKPGRKDDSPIEIVDGKAGWTPQKDDRYMVTGVDVHDKRFRLMYNSWFMAAGINVYRGRKWLVRDGKRYLIQSVYN